MKVCLYYCGEGGGNGVFGRFEIWWGCCGSFGGESIFFYFEIVDGGVEEYGDGYDVYLVESVVVLG